MGKRLKIYSKHPMFKMAGIALKGRCGCVSIMGLPDVSFKEKKFTKEAKKYIISQVERNAAFSRCW